MAITVTENAAKHIRSALAKRGGVGLRLGIKTVGCSGLAYTFDYAHEIGANDELFETRDVTVVVDRKSLEFVDGSVLDYARDGLNETVAGRTGRPELVVRREILLDEDRDRAWQLGSAARGALTRMYSAYNPPDRSVDYQHLSSADAASARAKEVYVFTDPDGAVDELKALEAAGITKVVLRMQWFDLPQDRMLHSLELFRQKVLPAFR